MSSAPTPASRAPCSRNSCSWCTRDWIVSTGANIVDQDFFEALGFKHYQAQSNVDDRDLRDLYIDRIYDTYIDEEELQNCDGTIYEICELLEPRPYSSREFIHEMGKWLAAEASVLVLDQPTSGVDVGSRAQIYAQINELVEAGAA